MKCLVQLGSFTCLLWLAHWLPAQAVATAERGGAMQVGATWSVAKADYGGGLIQGASVYGTYDFARRLGIEGNIHRTSAFTPGGIGEDSYLLGPRYSFRYGRFNPYVKGLVGIGQFKYKIPKTTTYTYKMIYAFGGGIDTPLARKINLRLADFEYQQWPGFPPTGLTPMVLSFGAAYSFR